MDTQNHHKNIINRFSRVEELINEANCLISDLDTISGDIKDGYKSLANDVEYLQEYIHILLQLIAESGNRNAKIEAEINHRCISEDIDIKLPPISDYWNDITEAEIEDFEKNYKWK